MNLIDVVIVVLVLTAVGFAIRRIYRNSKSGGCGCGCSGCAKADKCHK